MTWAVISPSVILNVEDIIFLDVMDGLYDQAIFHGDGIASLDDGQRGIGIQQTRVLSEMGHFSILSVF